MPIPVFLLASYDFRVLMRQSRFLMQVTSNKGSKRANFNSVKLTPKKRQFISVLLESYDF